MDICFIKSSFLNLNAWWKNMNLGKHVTVHYSFPSIFLLLVAGHFSKSLLKLFSDSFQLLQLHHQLIFQPVNLDGNKRQRMSMMNMKEVITSIWSFWTDLSANSALASACFSFAVSVLTCSLLAISLWFAFSSDTSRDFRLLATTLDFDNDDGGEHVVLIHGESDADGDDDGGSPPSAPPQAPWSWFRPSRLSPQPVQGRSQLPAASLTPRRTACLRCQLWFLPPSTRPQFFWFCHRPDQSKISRERKNISPKLITQN